MKDEAMVIDPPAAHPLDLAVIRADHVALAGRISLDDDLEREAAAKEIRAFLERVRRAGRRLRNGADRLALQRILNHWTTVLCSIGVVPSDDFSFATLDDYMEEAGAAEAEVATSSTASARNYVRIAAAARQWLTTHHDGYLLSGEALEEARAFISDPDIAALVVASDVAATRHHRTMITVLVATIAVLAGLALFALIQWQSASNQARVKEGLREELADALKNQEQLYANLQAQAIEAEKARSTEADANRQLFAKAIDAIIVELQLSQSGTDIPPGFDALPREIREAVLATIRDRLDAGRLTPEALRPDVRRALDGTQPPALDNPLDGSFLNGYVADFTGINIPLPILSAESVETQLGSDRAVAYLNYSLVLEPARRLPLFTAANLNRSERVSLPRGSGAFRIDPRLSAAVQPDPAWYASHRMDRGRLVARDDIAWGPLLGGDPIKAAVALDQSVDVYTNTAPMFSIFNREVWNDLETWVRAAHNPLATRVTIFTGPVLAVDDPVVDNVQLPRAFWKVVVSRPVASQAGKESASPGLVVDAFLVRQTEDDEARSALQSFDPLYWRVPVADIEVATGLHFPDEIRLADAGNPQRTLPSGENGTALASAVDRLDAADLATRQSTTQTFVNVLRDNSLVVAEQRKVLLALVTLLSPDRFSELSTNGRYNLLYVLSKVPAEKWAWPAWQDLRTGATQALGDVDRRVASNALEMGPRTRGQLNAALQQLGANRGAALGTRPDTTVYFQFAGMARQDAEALSQALQAFGWQIPGEERQARAAGTNEIRYNPQRPEDRDAALRLAEDLAVVGHPVKAGAVPNSAILPGVLEIWISS